MSRVEKSASTSVAYPSMDRARFSGVSRRYTDRVVMPKQMPMFPMSVSRETFIREIHFSPHISFVDLRSDFAFSGIAFGRRMAPTIPLAGKLEYTTIQIPTMR